MLRVFFIDIESVSAHRTDISAHRIAASAHRMPTSAHRIGRSAHRKVQPAQNRPLTVSGSFHYSSFPIANLPALMPAMRPVTRAEVML